MAFRWQADGDPILRAGWEVLGRFLSLAQTHQVIINLVQTFIVLVQVGSFHLLLIVHKK